MGRASRLCSRGAATKDARGNGNPSQTSRGQKQLLDALLAGEHRYRGYSLLLQITALHTKVGKGHLKLDLNLVSGGWQRSHLGLAARASSPTPLKPQTLTLHLLHHLYS